MEFTYKKFLTRHMQIWAEAKKHKKILSLTK